MSSANASLLYSTVQAGLDRTTLSSLGASALIELDLISKASDTISAAATAPVTIAPGFFASFEPSIVGAGLAGTLSGPRDLLAPSDVCCGFTEAQDKDLV